MGSMARIHIGTISNVNVNVRMLSTRSMLILFHFRTNVFHGAMHHFSHQKHTFAEVMWRLQKKGITSQAEQKWAAKFSVEDAADKARMVQVRFCRECV